MERCQNLLFFLVKSFLGNFYRHLATFYWSHWSPHSFGSVPKKKEEERDSLASLSFMFSPLNISWSFYFQNENRTTLHRTTDYWRILTIPKLEFCNLIFGSWVQAAEGSYLFVGGVQYYQIDRLLVQYFAI